MGLAETEGKKAARSQLSTHKPRPACQVEGCTRQLPEDTRYHRRYHICAYHVQIPSIEIRGQGTMRFCQQCGRFQPIQDFDGLKKSCRRKLMIHNAQRKVTRVRRTQSSSPPKQRRAGHYPARTPSQELPAGLPPPINQVPNIQMEPASPQPRSTADSKFTNSLPLPPPPLPPPSPLDSSFMHMHLDADLLDGIDIDAVIANLSAEAPSSSLPSPSGQASLAPAAPPISSTRADISMPSVLPVPSMHPHASSFNAFQPGMAQGYVNSSNLVWKLRLQSQPHGNSAASSGQPLPPPPELQFPPLHPSAWSSKHNNNNNNNEYINSPVEIVSSIAATGSGESQEGPATKQ